MGRATGPRGAGRQLSTSANAPWYQKAARTANLLHGATIALYSTDTLFGPDPRGGGAPADGVALAMDRADIKKKSGNVFRVGIFLDFI